MLERIIKAEVKSGYRIHLRYADGQSIEVEFSELIEKGGVFAALKDPSFFEKVSIGEDGRNLCWPGDLDFCADALRMQGRAISSEAA